MSFRLYLDEDSERHALIEAIEKLGMDVRSAGSLGMRRATDEQQLSVATREGRILVSANRRDFSRLHVRLVAAGEHHSGIILLHQRRYGVGEQMRRLDRIHAALTADDFVDRLEWLSAWGPPAES